MTLADCFVTWNASCVWRSNRLSTYTVCPVLDEGASVQLKQDTYLSSFAPTQLGIVHSSSEIVRPSFSRSSHIFMFFGSEQSSSSIIFITARTPYVTFRIEVKQSLRVFISGISSSKSGRPLSIVISLSSSLGSLHTVHLVGASINPSSKPVLHRIYWKMGSNGRRRYGIAHPSPASCHALALAKDAFE